jgi:hypothetical protein
MVLHRVPCNSLPGNRKNARLLLESCFSFHFVTQILDILESVSDREEWKAVMAAAGPLRTLQISLEDMTAALSATADGAWS